MMRRMALILIAMTMALLTLPAFGAMTVEFGASTVTVRGVSKKARVAVLAEARRPMGTYSQLSHIEAILTDDQANGFVVYDLKAPVPIRSVWAFVDVETGEVVVGTPGDFPKRQKVLADTSLKTSVSPDVSDFLETPSFMQSILVVRPKQDAWVIRASDVHGTGKVNASLASFQSLSAKTKDLKKFQNGDVIVILEPMTMQFSTTRIGK